MVSYSPPVSRAAERSVLPSILSVPPRTGDPPPLTLLFNHEGWKLAGSKSELELVFELPDEVVLVELFVLDEQAARMSAALATAIAEPASFLNVRTENPFPSPPMRPPRRTRSNVNVL